MEQIKLSANHAVLFRPKPKSSRTYGISIKYFDDSQEEPVKRIDYQVELLIEQYKNLEHTWQLSFNKEELFIDRHEPDLISEQLGNLAMKALYPVKVDVNQHNEIFKGITNHSDILARWDTVSKEIGDKYIGEYAELFIEKMNLKIQDAWEIEQALAFDMFWKAFFHPQYFSYGNDLVKETVFEFPVLPYQQVEFPGRQVLKENYTDYGTYSVTFNADTDVPEQLNDKRTGSGKARMKLDAQFELDQDGGLLKHTVIKWGIYQQTVDQQVKCSRGIHFSAYEIASENKIAAGTHHMVVEEGHSPAVKKGFWERILG